MLGGKRVERTDDPDQQHQPEKQTTDSKKQYCR